MTEVKPANLDDFLDSDTANATRLSMSAALAAERHEDFQETIGAWEPSEEEASKIFDGKGDPAERAYQAAKKATTFEPTPLADVLAGKKRDFHKPEPGSLEAILKGDNR